MHSVPIKTMHHKRTDATLKVLRLHLSFVCWKLPLVVTLFFTFPMFFCSVLFCFCFFIFLFAYPFICSILSHKRHTLFVLVQLYLKTVDKEGQILKETRILLNELNKEGGCHLYRQVG